MACDSTERCLTTLTSMLGRQQLVRCRRPAAERARLRRFGVLSMCTTPTTGLPGGRTCGVRCQPFGRHRLQAVTGGRARKLRLARQCHQSRAALRRCGPPPQPRPTPVLSSARLSPQFPASLSANLVRAEGRVFCASQIRVLEDAEKVVLAATAALQRSAAIGCDSGHSSQAALLRGPALALVDLAARRLCLALPAHSNADDLNAKLAKAIAKYVAAFGESASCATDLRRVRHIL